MPAQLRTRRLSERLAIEAAPRIAEATRRADDVVATCLDDPDRYPGFLGLIVVTGWTARVHRSAVRSEYLIHGSVKALGFRAFGRGLLRKAGVGAAGEVYWAVLERPDSRDEM